MSEVKIPKLAIINEVPTELQTPLVVQINEIKTPLLAQEPSSKEFIVEM